MPTEEPTNILCPVDFSEISQSLLTDLKAEPIAKAAAKGPQELNALLASLRRDTVQKPVIYVGGGVILGNAAAELTKLARAMNIPVTTTLMGLGSFPEDDQLSLGLLGMHGSYYANMGVSHSDLLVAVGARFDDRATGRVAQFCPTARVIHVDIDGLSIAYKQAGQGVPLVLLHGFLCDSRCWRTQLAWLSDQFRVVAWDAPGAGGSCCPCAICAKTPGRLPRNPGARHATFSPALTSLLSGE